MESQSCAITYPFASHPIHKGSVNLMKVDYLYCLDMINEIVHPILDKTGAGTHVVDC